MELENLKDIAEKVGNIVVQKGKAARTIVTEKSKEARDYAKDAMEIANLKNQINTCTDLINKNYVTLGEFYYKQNKENPDEEMKETVEAIAKAEETVAELKEKIDDIKSAQVEIRAAKMAAQAEWEEEAEKEQAEEEQAGAEETSETPAEEESAEETVDEELANINNDSEN